MLCGCFFLTTISLEASLPTEQVLRHKIQLNVITLTNTAFISTRLHLVVLNLLRSQLLTDITETTSTSNAKSTVSVSSRTRHATGSLRGDVLGGRTFTGHGGFGRGLNTHALTSGDTLVVHRVLLGGSHTSAGVKLVDGSLLGGGTADGQVSSGALHSEDLDTVADELRGFEG